MNIMVKCKYIYIYIYYIYIHSDENDIRDGHGVLIRSFTSRFEGFWVNGQIHGFGRLINHASIIVEGPFIYLYMYTLYILVYIYT